MLGQIQDPPAFPAAHGLALLSPLPSLPMTIWGSGTSISAGKFDGIPMDSSAPVA